MKRGDLVRVNVAAFWMENEEPEWEYGIIAEDYEPILKFVRVAMFHDDVKTFHAEAVQKAGRNLELKGIYSKEKAMADRSKYKVGDLMISHPTKHVGVVIKVEKDFYVSRPSFGSSVNIINGNRTTRSEWNLTLAAQSLGIVSIPSFTVDGTSSKSIEIRVTADQNEPQMSELVEVHNQLGKETLYPNQSTTLKTRLIIKADPRRLQNPKIAAPSVQGLSLEAIGEPNQYQSVLDGVEVTVVDQNYRVTADQPGDYVITGIGFKGSLVYSDKKTGATKLMSIEIGRAHV